MNRRGTALGKLPDFRSGESWSVFRLLLCRLSPQSYYKHVILTYCSSLFSVHLSPVTFCALSVRLPLASQRPSTCRPHLTSMASSPVHLPLYNITTVYVGQVEINLATADAQYIWITHLSAVTMHTKHVRQSTFFQTLQILKNHHSLQLLKISPPLKCYSYTTL